MKRKTAFLILILFAIITQSSTGGHNYTAIIDSFNSTGLELEEIRISGWAILEEYYGGEDELKKLADSVCEYMEIQSGETEVNKDGDNKKVVVKGERGEESIYLAVESIYNAISKSYQSIICVDITQCADLLNINNTGNRLLKDLYKYSGNPRLNICITGYMEGMIEQGTRDGVIRSLIDTLGVKDVESVEDDNLISICGYTRSIKDFIKPGNKRVNINIASRYSPYDDRTYFWLGTPVLNIEY